MQEKRVSPVVIKKHAKKMKKALPVFKKDAGDGGGSGRTVLVGLEEVEQGKNDEEREELDESAIKPKPVEKANETANSSISGLTDVISSIISDRESEPNKATDEILENNDSELETSSISSEEDETRPQTPPAKTPSKSKVSAEVLHAIKTRSKFSSRWMRFFNQIRFAGLNARCGKLKPFEKYYVDSESDKENSDDEGKHEAWTCFLPL